MAIKKNISNAARLLVEQYGIDSLAYFALHDKKKFFFSSTGKSFLAYTIEGKVVLVTGNPIGPSYDIPVLLEEFNYFIKGANRSSCYIGITEEVMPQLSQYGHKVLPMGTEAIINLSQFNKALLKKKVRRAEKHILNLGIECKIFKRSSIPRQYLQHMQSVSYEWLKEKGQKERGYVMTLGRFPQQRDNDYEIVLAVKNHEILGYLTFAPVYAAKSLSLDSMRRKIHAPNGLTEFLILQACEYYKSRDINTLSLNFAVFYQQSQLKGFNVTNMIIPPIYRILSHCYKTNFLYNFNNKFLPHWKERYIAFEKRRYVPYYLYAIAKNEL